VAKFRRQRRMMQKIYFDDSGMLQRHDYFTDVAKGNAAYRIGGASSRFWSTQKRVACDCARSTVPAKASRPMTATERAEWFALQDEEFTLNVDVVLLRHFRTQKQQQNCYVGIFGPLRRFVFLLELGHASRHEAPD